MLHITIHHFFIACCNHVLHSLKAILCGVNKAATILLDVLRMLLVMFVSIKFSCSMRFMAKPFFLALVTKIRKL